MVKWHSSCKWINTQPAIWCVTYRTTVFRPCTERCHLYCLGLLHPPVGSHRTAPLTSELILLPPQKKTVDHPWSPYIEWAMGFQRATCNNSQIYHYHQTNACGPPRNAEEKQSSMLDICEHRLSNTLSLWSVKNIGSTVKHTGNRRWIQVAGVQSTK